MTERSVEEYKTWDVGSGNVAETVSATSAVNPYNINFENKDSCQRFIDRCVVRWGYSLRLVNDGDEDAPNWRAVARRIGGTVHDTQHPKFEHGTDDGKLDPYVVIYKHNDKKFTIGNKF